jgi:hypothetical protein
MGVSFQPLLISPPRRKQMTKTLYQFHVKQETVRFVPMTVLFPQLCRIADTGISNNVQLYVILFCFIEF